MNKKMRDVSPSAARLTESLRDIGYDFPTAVADLVDNSIAAGATTVDVDIVYDGHDSYVTIADDGSGMTANGLVEAFRFGSRRDYERGQLGRYGLGLKTASLSQARRITVASRRRSETTKSPVTSRTLDLDIVREWDQWLIVEAKPTPPVAAALERLRANSGTVVVWEQLDRVLAAARADTGYGRRRLTNLREKVAAHLAMVFHRFLEGSARHSRRIVITLNGEKLRPWNPFAPAEPSTVQLDPMVFDLPYGSTVGKVRLERFILPHRDEFSSTGEFENLSGPLKWNRQQGLYVYRADRLVQWGGWAGTRAIDEHTKLARASLDFDTDLDDCFNINVAKMRLGIPTELRQMLEGPVKELCIRASDAYRRGQPSGRSQARWGAQVSGDIGAVGIAVQLAALDLGLDASLNQILDLVEERDPALGAVLKRPRT